MPRTITIPDSMTRRISDFHEAATALSDAEERGNTDPDRWADNDDEARAIVDQITALLDMPQETRP